MLENPNGSIWAAAAAQNAARAQANLAPAAPVAPKVVEDPTMIKIQHDPNRRAVFDGGAKAQVIASTPAQAVGAHGKTIAAQPAVQPVRQAPVVAQDQVMTSIRIPHTQAQAPRPAAPVAAQPVAARQVAQTQTTASGGIRATKDDEDGVVLRWR